MKSTSATSPAKEDPVESEKTEEPKSVEFGKLWAFTLRRAMLRDPKHRGLRLNQVIENKRKDKVEEPNSLLRRYRDRYRSF